METGPGDTAGGGELTHTAFYSCESTGQAGWIPVGDIRLPIDDLGFRQAVTAVERLRTYRGVLFQAPRHLARLAGTLAAIGLESAFGDVRWAVLLDELIERNRDWIESQGDVGVTIWATPGSHRATRPTYALHLNRIDPVVASQRRELGQTVVLTDVQQPSPACWSRQAKVRSRLHYYLADQQAGAIHPGATGVLCDTDGSWTESGIANLGLVIGDEILLPPLSQVLGGITQSFAIECAERLGIAIRHQNLSTADIARADAMLLMGTDCGIWYANQVFQVGGTSVVAFPVPREDSVVRRLQREMPESEIPQKL
ncbi:branched-chain amino acid aminotransferase [Neorhodopirellula lusitana]|uniref:Branched-chain amino acid aminotransferase n=1 Tax=Neorhodopirellula lusitana TaxID=445327 RepID=A0ABY1PP71_9BACT|nr:aminotransferase class IV [Neorhodopirellula lusitana]SMP38030.1 branched-chain amino acid aminotransferase [Neorhodopirellula lusitana]